MLNMETVYEVVTLWFRTQVHEAGGLFLCFCLYNVFCSGSSINSINLKVTKKTHNMHLRGNKSEHQEQLQNFILI